MLFFGGVEFITVLFSILISQINDQTIESTESLVCNPPKYKNKEDTGCNVCEFKPTSGYIKATKSCEPCTDGLVYSAYILSCHDPELFDAYGNEN